MSKDNGLVYIGKIVQMDKVPNAHFIASATVVCGSGGKWRGVVRKNECSVGQKCLVYLPDAVVPECDQMRFMESRNWRVRMCRFRGAPSEVLIMPIPDGTVWEVEVGVDVTAACGVTRYFKPIPVSLQGLSKGEFPSFIPKTDEPNYQRNEELVDALHGQPYYITEKADGSSTTAYKYKRQYGICSKNLELIRNDANGYWQVANKYNLEDNLPEGYALQWETCGPKIQKNPMDLKSVEGFAFSAYNIEERRYLTMDEFLPFCRKLRFPTVTVLQIGPEFNKDTVSTLGEGKYNSGKDREGVVVRSQTNHCGTSPISFKVINLSYET
jgi:RNA ligase (TIGR02306 family)